MGTTVHCLWPTPIAAKPLPMPAQRLREQGLALKQVTEGKLYGDLLRSDAPSPNTITYDLFVCVDGKPYRHKLLSVEVGLLLDYPVTILNHEAGSQVRLANEQQFLEHLELILSSEATRDLLGRLLCFADP